MRCSCCQSRHTTEDIDNQATTRAAMKVYPKQVAARKLSATQKQKKESLKIDILCRPCNYKIGS